MLIQSDEQVIRGRVHIFIRGCSLLQTTAAHFYSFLAGASSCSSFIEPFLTQYEQVFLYDQFRGYEIRIVIGNYVTVMNVLFNMIEVKSLLKSTILFGWSYSLGCRRPNLFHSLIIAHTLFQRHIRRTFRLHKLSIILRE